MSLGELSGLEEQAHGHHDLASLPEAALDLLPAAVYTTDAEGRITYFNPACVAFSGRTPTLGTDHWCVTWKLFNPDGRPMSHDECPMAITLKTGREVRGAQAIAERPDGTRIWFEPHPTLLRDKGGKVVGAINMLVDITDSKRNEEALRESEERYRRTLSLMPAAVYSCDSAGVITFFNDRAAQLWGRAPRVGDTDERFCGSEQMFLTDGTPLPHDQCPMAVALREGKSFRDQEVNIRRPDGSSVTVRVNIDPIRNEQGEVIGAINAFHDVTAVKKAEQALRESEERYRAIVESQVEMVCRFQVEGTILFVNGAYARAMGTNPEELVGANFWSFIDPADRQTVKEMLHRLTPDNPQVMIENRFETAEGTRWTLWVNRGLVFDDQGRATEAQSSGIDITDRRQAEEALREQAQTLEILNRVGSQLAAELDTQKLIQAVTDAGTELSGAKFGAFFFNTLNEKGESYVLYTLSGAPREAFEKFSLPRNTPVFEPTFSGQAIVRSDDITKDPRYGRVGPHHGMPKGHLPVRSYLAVPVVSRSGEVLGGLFFGHPDVGVFTEQAERLITGIAAQAAIAVDNAKLYQSLRENELQLEQRVLERTEELERANREMEGFTYSISHDLRSPLRAIVSASHVLQEDFADKLPPAAADILRRQAENANKMAVLIDDLLKYSRLGRVELKSRQFDLSCLARSVGADVAPLHPSVTFQVADGMLACGDEEMIRLALHNLLDNAAKFSPEGGTIEVGFHNDGGSGAFFVKDQGVGFDKQYAAKLFKPFERLHRDEEFPGTGIGLANVRRIIERHGGRVWAESEGVGMGATFFFTLPAPTGDC